MRKEAAMHSALLINLVVAKAKLRETGGPHVGTFAEGQTGITALA